MDRGIVKEKYDIVSLDDMPQLAKAIVSQLSPGSIVCLEGDLGAGKTTLVRAMCSTLGVDENLISSPTFTYLQTYKTEETKICHFDFYRLKKTEHIVALGFMEYMVAPYFTFIEWPQIVRPLLDNALWIELDHQPNGRKVTLWQL